MKKIISIIGFTIACLFIFSAEAVERRVANNAEFAEAYSLSLDNDEITVTNFDYYYVVGGINVGEPGYILDRKLNVLNATGRNDTTIYTKIYNSSSLVKGFTTAWFKIVLDGTNVDEYPAVQDNIMYGSDDYGGGVKVIFNNGAKGNVPFERNTFLRSFANILGASYAVFSLNGSSGNVLFDHNTSLEPYTYGNAVHGYVNVGADSELNIEWKYDEQIAGDAAKNTADALTIYNDGVFNGEVDHTTWASYKIIRLVSGPNATSSKMNIRNSIIMGRIIVEGDWELTIAYSSLHRPVEGEYTDIGNIFGDPLFVREWDNYNPYDYNLQADSPCIGAGRELDGTITDMGAYEYRHPDTDGDGVKDPADLCPGTPAGVSVGPDGCPHDADEDGTPDYIDECDDDPAKIFDGVCGCNFADIDADSDGVLDCNDDCADTPADVLIDNRGCPLPVYDWYRDGDGDGYSDGEMLSQALRPAGYYLTSELIALSGDCRDDLASVNPGASEICGNGIDEDCSGAYEICPNPCAEFTAEPTSCGIGNCRADGFTTCTNVDGTAVLGNTCLPGNPSAEICGDGLDQDCSGADEICLPPIYNWFKDLDGDGYSDGEMLSQALRPAGYYLTSELIALSGDCRDDLASVNPGASEICGNGIDEDCSGAYEVCPFNSNPTAIIKDERRSSSQTLIVELDGSDSFDPEGDELTYTWSKDGIVCGDTPQIVYDLRVGTHVFRLVVTDSQGAEDSAEITITVGEEPASLPATDSGGGGGGGCFLSILGH